MEIFRNPFTTTEVQTYTEKRAKKLVERGESIKLQNNLIIVDFSKTESFRDPNFATGCVVALASDGTKGVISHIQTDAKVDKIADRIASVFQKTVPVCLSGGVTGLSDNLIGKIFEEFSKRELIVSASAENNDIGGSWKYRNATLYPDFVIIDQECEGKPDSSTLKLTFPKLEPI